MDTSRFDGVGTINGGTYEAMTIDGVYSCSGNVKAKSVSIDGVFNSEGAMEAGYLDIDGITNFKSNVKAGKLVVDGILNVKDTGKIEATEVLCNGVINADGEVSADIIEADGYVNAQEIVGDHVIIKSRLGFLVNLFVIKLSKVRFIEATTVELRGVKAEVVNGRDITIGPKCKITNIDCSGTLYIDPSATVGSVTGEYTLRPQY